LSVGHLLNILPISVEKAWAETFLARRRGLNFVVFPIVLLLIAANGGLQKKSLPPSKLLD
jgi:hypothetical protein